MNILEKLFGSSIRVKTLRLFLLSPNSVFSSKEAAKILKSKYKIVAKETHYLCSIGFLKKSSRVDKIIKCVSGKDKYLKKKIQGFVLSSTFPIMVALKNLLINASPVSRERMLKYFKNKGKIKLLVLGGVFVQNTQRDIFSDEPYLDLLVVGSIERGSVTKFIRKLEAEIGKELNWTLLSTAEFDNRLSMHDRLLRDLLDYPHEFLINKLGVV